MLSDTPCAAANGFTDGLHSLHPQAMPDSCRSERSARFRSISSPTAEYLMLIAKHLQQLNPARSVRQINADTPVKPPNQRRIQCACTAVIAAKIGGGHPEHSTGLSADVLKPSISVNSAFRISWSAVMKSFSRSSAGQWHQFHR